MKWSDFFYGIQDFFVNFAFKPYDWLRELQLKSWVLANTFNFIIILTIASLFVYWMLQLKKYDDDEVDHYAAEHRDKY